MIKPSLWEELEIAYDLDGDLYGIRRFRKPEFFEPHEIPTNVDFIPEWLTALAAQQIDTLRNLDTGSETRLALFSAVEDTFVVDGSAKLSKADAAVFSALLKHRRLDEAADRELQDYTFLDTDILAEAVGTNDVSLRKRILRLRKKIGAQAIDSIGWHGYRLSPYLIEAPHAVIRARLRSQQSRGES